MDKSPDLNKFFILIFFLFVFFIQESRSQTIAKSVLDRDETPLSITSMTVDEQFDFRSYLRAQASSKLQIEEPKIWSEQNSQAQGKPDSSKKSSTSNATRLTAKEKLAFAFKRSFLSPAPYASTAFGATVTQLGEKYSTHKDFEDKFADGLSRYAINFATSSTRRMFVMGIYPIVFKQDPRYKPSGKSSFKSRALYAASRVFVTTDSNGKLQPNYSQIAGNLTASSLANIWERNTFSHERIGVVPTFRRFQNMMILDVVSFIVLREFGPDIKKKIWRK